jgi:hypothetical protein
LRSPSCEQLALAIAAPAHAGGTLFSAGAEEAIGGPTWAGETARVEFGLLKRRICIAGRRALGPVQLTIDGVKRRWVKISGIRRALAECEGRA